MRVQNINSDTYSKTGFKQNFKVSLRDLPFNMYNVEPCKNVVVDEAMKTAAKLGIIKPENFFGAAGKFRENNGIDILIFDKTDPETDVLSSIKDSESANSIVEKMFKSPTLTRVELTTSIQDICVKACAKIAEAQEEMMEIRAKVMDLVKSGKAEVVVIGEDGIESPMAKPPKRTLN